jgi:serine/threonine-protein kinase RsbW
MSQVVNLKLPSRPEFINIARMNISVIANNMNMNYEVIQDLKVAISEACNNVILHSESKSHYEIDFIIKKEKLVVEISDFGSGFDIEDYNKPNLENPKESGLGLFIIDSLMDEFKIETKNGNGTVIRMIKNI